MSVSRITSTIVVDKSSYVVCVATSTSVLVTVANISVSVTWTVVMLVSTSFSVIVVGYMGRAPNTVIVTGVWTAVAVSILV